METELRKNGVNTIGWKYTKKILKADDMGDFVIMLNRRDIRSGQVTKLKNLLDKGEHFETPLVANIIKGKYRLIDGNHRIEALKLFFDKYPDRSVEIGICYYENLSEDEEKHIFTKWNMVTKQSCSDFIKIYWNDIPVTSMMKRPAFPLNVSHTWSGSNIDFKQLIYPYLVKDNNTLINFRGSALDFIEEAKKLNKDDIKVLKEFMTEFISIFGEPSKLSLAYKPLNFTVITRIWLRNYKYFTPETIIKRLSKLRQHERMQYWYGYSASQNQLPLCLRDFLEVVNGGVQMEINKLKA